MTQHNVETTHKLRLTDEYLRQLLRKTLRDEGVEVSDKLNLRVEVAGIQGATELKAIEVSWLGSQVKR